MAAPEPVAVEALGSEGTPSVKPALSALLKDVVDGDASVGFLPPLLAEEASAYWESVAMALKGDGRRLWIARAGGGTLHATAFDYKLLDPLAFDPLTLPSPPVGERG